jgi:hypothetical protein
MRPDPYVTTETTYTSELLLQLVKLDAEGETHVLKVEDVTDTPHNERRKLATRFLAQAAAYKGASVRYVSPHTTTRTKIQELPT